MKAITLHQPWATLIALREKRIETRSWGTNYRGPIAIHAGKTINREACCLFEIMAALSDHGYQHSRELPTGAVIAIGELVDCFLMTPEWLRELTVEDRWYGDYRVGRFAWVIDDVQPITPVPQRGYQGLWDWEETGAA